MTIARLGRLFEQKKAAVARPVRQELTMIGLQQQFVFTGSVGSALVQVKCTYTVRRICDSRPVRRPGSIHIDGSSRIRKSSPSAVRQVDQPNVVGSGPIYPFHCDLGTVR